MVRKKRSFFGRILMMLQYVLVGGLIAGIFATSGILLWAATLQIPDFSLFESRKVSQSTKIYDRTGKILLYDVHKDVKRTIVPFNEISTNIKNATVAIEDDEFYQHHGIKPKAILRAILVNLQSGGFSQGGSTITQQVIKNALLSQEKTITRKIKEWILAIKLERVLSKEDILALYLNEAPYGGSIYGVEEASMSFFGKRAKDVSLSEAAYLAALPQAPSLYSPYSSDTTRLENRKSLVLDRMRSLNMIGVEDAEAAKKEKVKFIPPSEQGIRAPHFVMFVRDKLAEMFSEEVLNEGGLRVITTLDMVLQEKAEETVAKFAKDNEVQFKASNEALVALDPKTGGILVMVGSRDYFDIKRDGNFNVATARRQPGSAFKPIVYAAAFEKGYTSDTVVFDVPTQFSTRCDSDGNPLYGLKPDVCYMPENYDHQYHGPITLRNALAQSVNIPAVKMLYLVGFDAAIDMAERLGITTLADKARYGLTLVLGGGEVSLLDISSAYGVFANNGTRVPYSGILRIEDNKGNVVIEESSSGTQVIDPEVAHSISSVLSDNTARTPAFGAQSYLNFPDREVAVKTGTTNDYRDAWIIGYTPSLVVGAWAGNNDNSPMEKKVAGFIVAPMWNAFFSQAFASMPQEYFSPPRPVAKNIKPALRGVWYGGQVYDVDRMSGKLATQYTPSEYIEERVFPNPHEILYWVDKDDPKGQPPANPYADPQFLLWELPVQKWISLNGLPKEAVAVIPEGFDDLHDPSRAPVITITTPKDSSIIEKSDKLLVSAQITSTYPIAHVDFFVNDIFIGTVRSMPYEFAFVPQDISGVSEENTLRIVASDFVGNESESRVKFLLYNESSYERNSF